MRPWSVGFLLPVISKYIDLTVWTIVFRPCHSGKMPTHAVLKKSHRMPTDTQPYEFVSMKLSEIVTGGCSPVKNFLLKM
jgi:hypothetical protein